MNRRHTAHLLALTAAALALKLWLFRDVALNGDTGLFLYDAKLLRLGQTMFVDFPSRSPAFEYLLALTTAGAGSTIVKARATMVALSLGVGLVTYALARQLHSHAAGLIAAAAVYFVPYPLVWGFWVKTEVVATGIAFVAFYIALRVRDHEHIDYLPLAAIGVTFAVATLVRRSVLVHIAAFGVWWLWYQRRYNDRLWPALGHGAVMATAWTAVLAVTYYAVAHGDLAVATKVADQHLIRLFTSDGAGVISWTAIDQPKAITAHEGGDLLGLLCQKCGANTVSVFSRVIMLVLPVLVVLLAFLRSYLREGNRFVADTAFPVAMITVALVRVGVLLSTDHVERVVTVAVFVGAIALVWWASEPVEWSALWRPEYGVLTTVGLALTFGYLWRDRILYVTYFQDFYPILAVLAGVTAVEWWRAQDWRLTLVPPLTFEDGWPIAHHKPVVKTLALLLILSGALFVSGANAYPYVPEGDTGGTNWFTVELVQEYGADIEARTEPGERVYTAQPLYVVDADRRIAADLSRKYYAFQGWPDHAATAAVERELAASLREGDAPLAIVGHTSLWTLRNSPTTRGLLAANYCRVEDDALYNRTGSHLYAYAPNATGCERFDHAEYVANGSEGG